MQYENKTISPPQTGYVPGCAFRINSAGCLSSFDGVRFKLGFYACWHIVVSGSGTVRCGDLTFTVRRGDMFSIMPDSEIEYFDDPASPWRYYWLHLEGPAMLEMCHEAGFSSRTPWFRPEFPDEVTRRFQGIWKELQGDLYWKPVEQAAKILELLVLLKQEPVSRRRSAAALAEHAVAVLEESSHLNMNVNELAAALCTDRISLYHAFRETLGVTPGKYIIARRMERCKDLLREYPDWPLWRIATMAGFNNEKYFIRAFRLAAGCTPGKFRSRQVEKM